MSWLTDLAGKAEDLLNNLDQGTATALQKTPGGGAGGRRGGGSPSKSVYVRPSSRAGDFAADGSAAPSMSAYATGSGGAAVTTTTTTATVSHHEYGVPQSTYKREHKSSGYASSVTSSTMVAAKQQQQKGGEDEKLLEFLNNDDQQPPPPRGLSRQSSSSSLRSMPSQFLSQFTAALTSSGDTTDAVAPPAAVGGYSSVAAAMNEREMEDLRAGRSDLLKTIQSKDGQLAVLRVRLQEADQMLQARTSMLDKLKADNDRLLIDSADSADVRNRALDSVADQMRDTESALEREKQNAKRIETEYQSRIQKLQDEVSTLSQGITAAQKELTDDKLRSKDAVDQLRLAKYNLEANKLEFDEYKQKAQKILQSKEKLITTLKEGGGAREAGSDENLAVELEEVRSERDILKEDVQQLQLQIYNLKSEIQDVETQLTQEQRAALEQQRGLQEQCQSFQENASQYREQLEQLKMEYQYIQDELRRQQAALHTKLQEKDAEIVRLMNQSAVRSMATTSGGELEQRIRYLMENLIQKQTTIETLQTDKNSLALQLERTQRMYREAESAAMRGASTAIDMGGGGSAAHEAGGGRSVPHLFRETPFDNGVAKGMKRAYGTLDKISVKVGLSLRRYPMARVALFVYMVILHFWVMIVMLTYSPEIHGSDFQPKIVANE